LIKNKKCLSRLPIAIGKLIKNKKYLSQTPQGSLKNASHRLPREVNKK
jgi:hypothetical protein